LSFAADERGSVFAFLSLLEGLSWAVVETLYYSRMDSPAGPLLIAMSDKGLVALEFDRGEDLRKKAAQWVESAEQTAQVRRELEEYFAGTRKEFTFPLDLRGTEFQKKCWQALLDIPYGETRSYADQARVVGSPNGFRAVGMANHDNPIAIVVPCHRVITSDGKLGGYGGGLDVKEKLLKLEGSEWPKQRRLRLGDIPTVGCRGEIPS
jgi:O-6-methylguanine DNA methyltransferase